MAMAALFKSINIMYSSRCMYNYIVRDGSALNRFNFQILHDKEVFVSRMERIFCHSQYYDPEVAKKMISFHAWDSVGYIVHQLTRFKLPLRLSYGVLSALPKTKLLNESIPRTRTLKRRVLRYIYSHPSLSLIMVMGIRLFRRGRN